jgi:hypothetical protein
MQMILYKAVFFFFILSACEGSKIRNYEDVRHRMAGSHVERQASFLNGRPCSHGIPESIRVDNFVNGLVASEMKNYNLTTNQAGLVRDIVDQAIKHQRHLPPGTRQTFTIDTRGQVCTLEMRENIRSTILRKTNGVLTDNDINFW